MKRLSWDTIVASALTALIVLAGWTYTAGKLQGETATKVRQLEYRVDACERDIKEQLQMLSTGLTELTRMIEVMQAEQRLLHKRELGRSDLAR